VKHLLVADLSKRYGNLKNGFNDIKNHRWFKNLNWEKLKKKMIPVPYKPIVKAPNDTSNFTNYPESETESPPLNPSNDPFLDW
jgi:protein kinase A